MARECYMSSLKTTREELAFVDVPLSEIINNYFECWDLILGVEAERLTSTEDLKEVQIGPHTNLVMKIGTLLPAEEERELVDQLIKNVNLFARVPSDMSGIDTQVVNHRLAIHPFAKLVVKRKRKVGVVRRAIIDEELGKLLDVGITTKMKYPTWLTNVVLVRKANNRGHMCVDFTDLNSTTPNDPYTLLDIDSLIDESLGYFMLSFMDVY